MNMKKENSNGITLISLAVSVVVLLIIASVGTYSGMDSIETSKINKFEQELTVLQAEIDLLYEKYKDDNITINSIGKTIPDNKIEKANIAFSQCDIQLEERQQYKLFDEETLKKLNIDAISGEYLVNIKKRHIISLEGFKAKDTVYYSLKDFKNTPEIQKFERTGYVTVENVSYVRSDTGFKITLENIKCSKYVGKYNVAYRKSTESNYKTSAIDATGKDYSFTVDTVGKYYIKITDAAGRTTETPEIVIDVN